MKTLENSIWYCYNYLLDLDYMTIKLLHYKIKCNEAAGLCYSS